MGASGQSIGRADSKCLSLSSTKENNVAHDGSSFTQVAEIIFNRTEQIMENVQGPVELFRFFLTPEDTTAPQMGVAGPGIAGTLKVLFHIGLAMGLTMAISVLN
jgi:hypothetical protein